MPAQVLDLRGQLPTHPTEYYRWRVERYGADTRRNRLHSIVSIRQVVFHHSAVDVPYQGPHNFAFNIAMAHIRRGWPGAGYTGGIDRMGIILRFWDWWVWTYHVGYHNPWSVGWCLEGNYQDREVPEAMQHSMEMAYRMMQQAVDVARQELGLPAVRLAILGHRELSATACPGDYGQAAVEGLRG